MLAEESELQTYLGRSTPIVDFLRELADDLQGERVVACGADRFRHAEMQERGVRCPAALADGLEGTGCEFER